MQVSRVTTTALFLTLVLAFSLAPTCLSSEKVVLHFAGGPGWLEHAKNAIAAFEHDYPNIKVEPVPLEPPDDKFILMVAAGEPIDVFLNAHVFGWPGYTHDGLFLDLTPFIERDQAALGDIVPSAWRAARVGPVLSGMAGLSPGHGVVYNATFFKEAGLVLPPGDWEDTSWNWDVMVQVARKLTRTNSEGETVQWGVGFWDADNLIGFAWAFGGDWFDKESYTRGVVNKVTLTKPENVRAYEAIAELRTTGAQTHLGPIWSGQLAMGIDGLHPGIVDPQIRGDDMARFEWGFAAYPYADGVDRSKTFSWSGPFAAIMADTAHPQEAWEFVKYLTTSHNPAVSEWAYMSPMASTYVGLLEYWMTHDISAIPYDEMAQIMTQALERAMPLPRTSILGASEVWNVLSSRLIPALGGEVAVPTALEQAQDVATKAVAEVKEKYGIGF